MREIILFLFLRVRILKANESLSLFCEFTKSTFFVHKKWMFNQLKRFERKKTLNWIERECKYNITRRIDERKKWNEGKRKEKERNSDKNQLTCSSWHTRKKYLSSRNVWVVYNSSISIFSTFLIPKWTRSAFMWCRERDGKKEKAKRYQHRHNWVRQGPLSTITFWPSLKWDEKMGWKLNMWRSEDGKK